MARQLFAIAVAMALLVAVAAAAAETKPMFTDRFSKTVAKAAGYGGYDGEAESKTVYFQDSKWSKCVLSGCTCWPYCTCFSDINAQTDFTCIPEQAYYGDGNEGLNTFLTTHNKAGSCTWKFVWYNIFYQWNTVAPVTVDGLANTIKWGDVTGTCYVNEANECGGPACNKMAISIQAGLYSTPAVSHSPFSPVQGPDANDDTCCMLDIFWGVFGHPEICSLRRTASKDAKQEGNKKRGDPSEVLQGLADLIKQYAPAGKGKVGAKVANIDVGVVPTTTYAGYAFVIAGPMQVTNPSKDDDYKENGFFEYVPFPFGPWEELTAGEAPPPDAHWVKPGGYKLRFFKKESEGSHYDKYERESGKY